MYVTIIMNKKTESNGLSFLFRFGVGHNGGICKRAFIWVTLEPGIELRHDSGDVFISMLNIKIFFLAIISNNWLIIKVPG